MDTVLRTEINNELTHFQTLTTEVETLESEVAGRMRAYEELRTGEVHALQIIQREMESWRAPRREKTAELVERLRAKWADLRNVPRGNANLDQEYQYFSAHFQCNTKSPINTTRSETAREDDPSRSQQN
jgi:hypothetical protein